jgi:hypothetical protein
MLHGALQTDFGHEWDNNYGERQNERQRNEGIRKRIRETNKEIIKRLGKLKV